MISMLERLWVLIVVIASPLFAVAAKVKPKTSRSRAPAKSKQIRAAPRRRETGIRSKTKRPTVTPKTKGRGAARDNRGLAPKPAAKPAPKAPPLPKPTPPFGRPILLSPENGKFADSIVPKFRWLSVGSATRYEIVWSQEPNLASAQSIHSVATEAAVPIEKALHIGATYYWRVRGGNDAGWGPWSSTASFRVLEEPEGP